MRAALQAEYGGSWDGGSNANELRGLIELNDKPTKVEISARPDGTWVCTLFRSGECVAFERQNDALHATRAAIAQLDHVERSLAEY